MELSPKALLMLDHAVGDSGKTPDDWLMSELLGWLKGSTVLFHRWQLGKRVDAKRRNARGEVEVYVVEPGEIEADRFTPTTQDNAPDAPGWLVFDAWPAILHERFGFAYSVNAITDARAGEVGRFTGKTFQEALNDLALALIVDGAAKEDERLIKEKQESLNDPKRKEKKRAEAKGPGKD